MISRASSVMRTTGPNASQRDVHDLGHNKPVVPFEYGSRWYVLLLHGSFKVERGIEKFQTASIPSTRDSWMDNVTRRNCLTMILQRHGRTGVNLFSSFTFLFLYLISYLLSATKESPINYNLRQII